MKKGLILASFAGGLLNGSQSLNATSGTDDLQMGLNQNPNVQGIQAVPDKMLFRRLYDLEKCDCERLDEISKISESMRDNVIYHLDNRVSDLRLRVPGKTYLNYFSKSMFAKSITHLNMNYLRNWSNDLIPIIFQSFPNLKCLNLHACNIDTDGADLLGDFLVENRTLETLDLSKNRVGNKGALYIKNALYSNSILKVLDLSYNDINDYGVSFLHDGLKYNSTLQSLILSSNGIRPEYQKDMKTNFGYRVSFVEPISYTGRSLLFPPTQ